jgi:hypothetical protein
LTPKVRLIDDDGNQLGVRSRDEALQLAADANMDLVEVAPQASPPVCKIMDWGKYRFEQSKKAQAARKKQKQVHVKEIKFRPGTDEHDYQVKVKHARTIECVVGGYRIHKSGEGVGSLLLGLYDDDGNLHHVGAAGAFSMKARKDLVKKLKPLEGGSGFPGGVILGGPSRWRQQEKDWIPLEPKLVVEVAYDHFQGGRRFRHLAQFLRWRLDRTPKACTFAQLSPSRG